MTIQYVTGDATRPHGPGEKIIAHVCNDAGVWGAGFVMALSRRWAAPEAAYHRFARGRGLILGDVQFVDVESGVRVANMIAQDGFWWRKSRGIPLQYDALISCLKKVAVEARRTGASVHMPRIGCGIAGGTWDRVESIIQRTIDGVEVTVYDLPAAK
jgi:O-acetyl-ADP-ribose deacetylase (regulator of RNase III)